MRTTKITEEDKVHIALASIHHDVIYCLDRKRLLKVKESCEPESMMSFIYCENLEEVVFTEEGQGLPGPVETMLIGCNKLKKIIVPDPVTENKYNFNSEKWDTGSFGHCNYNHLVVLE